MANDKDNKKNDTNSFIDALKKICTKIGSIGRKKKKCKTILDDGQEISSTAARG